MWLIGLIIGAIIGAIGGGAGAFFGAVAGAGLGWAMAKKWDGDDRFVRLESSIAYLQERVATLERAQPKAAFDQSPPHSEPSPSAPPVVAAETIQSDRAAVRVEPIASRLEAQPDPALRRPAPPAPSALWNFFFGGNALVRFGVVVLFFGVAFL